MDGDRQADIVAAYDCKQQMSGIEAVETARHARRAARTRRKPKV